MQSTSIPAGDAFAGLKFLSDEVMPIAVDADLLRKFEVWSNTPQVLAPRRAWYVRMWRQPRAWIPGTLEWSFRRWVGRKLFVVGSGNRAR